MSLVSRGSSGGASKPDRIHRVRHALTVVYLGWGQVYSSDAYPPVDLLAGTSWFSWCLGFRRLPFSPIPVWKCPVERFVQCLEGRNSTSPQLTLNFIGHKFLRPKSIHDNEIVEEYSKDYMYLACIHFINSVGNMFKLSPPPRYL